MKKYLTTHTWLFFLFMAIMAILFVSCQPKHVPPPPVEWNFQSGSIHVRYDAAADLNRYGGSPHTMMLVVFQLTDASDFMNYARTTDGIRRLMQIHDIDPRNTIGLKDMVDFQTFFINPGNEDTLKIDRVENAKWVGLVAGYFNIVPEHSSAVYQIPIDLKKEGFIRKKSSARPGDLHINIQLGTHAMHTIGDPS